MAKVEYKRDQIVMVESGEVLHNGQVIVRNTKPYKIIGALKSLYWIADVKTGMTDRIGKGGLPRPPKDSHSKAPYHRIIGLAPKKGS